MKKDKLYDRETKRAALHPSADINEDWVRAVRASVNGETLYQYEKRLKEIGLDF